MIQLYIYPPILFQIIFPYSLLRDKAQTPLISSKTFFHLDYYLVLCFCWSYFRSLFICLFFQVFKHYVSSFWPTTFFLIQYDTFNSPTFISYYQRNVYPFLTTKNSQIIQTFKLQKMKSALNYSTTFNKRLKLKPIRDDRILLNLGEGPLVKLQISFQKPIHIQIRFPYA